MPPTCVRGTSVPAGLPCGGGQRGGGVSTVAARTGMTGGRRGAGTARRSAPAVEAKQAAITVLGDRANLLIIREAFRRTRRYQEFKERLGVSDAVLASRLHDLVDIGVLQTVVYTRRPPRHEYRLTDCGIDFWQTADRDLDVGEAVGRPRVRPAPGADPSRLWQRDDCGVRVRSLCRGGSPIRATSRSMLRRRSSRWGTLRCSATGERAGSRHARSTCTRRSTRWSATGGRWRRSVPPCSESTGSATCSERSRSPHRCCRSDCRISSIAESSSVWSYRMQARITGITSPTRGGR